MIKNWLVTGDTHSVFSRFSNLTDYIPEETAIIVLGDLGCNFYLNKSDIKSKQRLSAFGFTIYAVRGNHEERPENLNIPIVYDAEVCGNIYREEAFPLINYFMDGEEYNIDGYHCLIIGGAYSVDKYYRINNYTQSNGWCGWFKDEQLTEKEMTAIANKIKGNNYDFILSHTCPYSWEPTDMFLNGIDQSTVDNTMEHWLNKIENNCKYHVWLFGHFHADRIEVPHAEMLYTTINNINDIYNRWKNYDIDGEQSFPWYICKSPKFERMCH